MIDIEIIKKVANKALQAARNVHDQLGAEGERKINKNQFGDTALKADIETEEAVLDVLKKYNLPLKVISEEHGIIIIGKEPRYLGILDSIDGSGVYMKSRGVGRYGTMLAIYKGLDPKYNDYIYGGIMEHVANKLYYASKGDGSWLVNEGQTQSIHCRSSKQLNKQRSKLYIDAAFDNIFGSHVFDEIVTKLINFNTSFTLSSCIQYADLANGAVDGVIECTRKGNLEIAAAYPLINEAGGVMVTKDAIQLGESKYNEFGQKDHFLVFSACTMGFAKSLLSFINH
ncbi:MAG: hypothetical protein HYW86_04105 [Candidatus Roizmanbacteria bacterium]|nr:MAG: hypothetical protein HYW86_04105 [Candidatus Roizmanbacteria bacterium]